MTRFLIILLAIAMLAVWILFYLIPNTEYPFSLEHIQGSVAAMRYLGYPF